jgi:hypothetical protein
MASKEVADVRSSSPTIITWLYLQSNLAVFLSLITKVSFLPTRSCIIFRTNEVHPRRYSRSLRISISGKRLKNSWWSVRRRTTRIERNALPSTLVSVRNSCGFTFHRTGSRKHVYNCEPILTFVFIQRMIITSVRAFHFVFIILQVESESSDQLV